MIQSLKKPEFEYFSSSVVDGVTQSVPNTISVVCAGGIAQRDLHIIIVLGESPTDSENQALRISQILLGITPKAPPNPLEE